MPSISPGPQLPTIGDVNDATARTAAVLSDPSATLDQRQAALDVEAATVRAYDHRPSAQHRLNIDPGNHPGTLSLAEWAQHADAGVTTYTAGHPPHYDTWTLSRQHAAAAAGQGSVPLIEWHGQHGRIVVAPEPEAS